MYYVDKKVYEAKDLQEKTQALKSDISVLLQFVGGVWKTHFRWYHICFIR